MEIPPAAVWTVSAVVGMPEAGLRGPGRPKGSLNRKGTKTRPGPAAIKAARAALRPRKSKVTTRGLDASGIPASHRRNNLNHTSFRLDERSRTKLRQLAKRTFGGTTMSAVLRLLIDEAWAREFARGKTRGVGRITAAATTSATLTPVAVSLGGCIGEDECDHMPWCQIRGRCQRLELPGPVVPEAHPSHAPAIGYDADTDTDLAFERGYEGDL